MEKRALLAIVISMVILFTWGIIFNPQKAPGDKPVQGEKVTAVTPSQPAKALQIAPTDQAQAAVTAGSTIVAETPFYTASFNSKGGQLTSLKLKRYRTTINRHSPPVELVKAPLPTLLLTGGFTDANLVYTCNRQGAITVSGNPYEIAFRGPAASGITIEKVFTIDPNTYLLGYRVTFENHTTAPIAVSGEHLMDGAYPLGEKLGGYAFAGPVLLNGKHLEEFKIDKVKKIESLRDFSGPIQWFGLEDKYFLQAIIPKVAMDTKLTIKRASEKLVEIHYAFAPFTIQPGAATSQENLIFIGPKELKTLQTVDYNLNKALDFGFFDIIAKPLLIAMNWIYKYIGSYGWTIIILTVIIKILLYPLTLKSFTSMKELQKIQPLMKQVQEQYKDDKQRLNQELMKLYKEHKINPMGGCLPMLLQIPILFALYKVFYQAIELRHTPFYIVGTWLPDLSAMDPYYITPILMGASQFVMQKMTPSTGDPTQQKVMLMMPVLFTFLFLNFPSGLVIYWLVSNILSIIQQTYINRKLV